MKGHDTLVEILNAEGVETMFSLLSEELMGVTMAAAADGPQVVQTRHEQSAVAMADGFSRTSDDVGVALVGRGPAVAQTGTALTTAYNHGSNVLLVVATRPRSSFTDELNKEFRQETFLDSLLEHVLTVWSPETFVPSFAEAFRRLHADEGPVAVQVPWDLLGEDLGEAGAWRDTTIGTRRPESSDASLRPDPAAVAAAADRYEAADVSAPPVILAGSGARDAAGAIQALAERLNAVVVTTLQCRDFLADHPYAAGFVGGFGDPAANEALERSEFVLALGASLNEHTTREGTLLAEGVTVHADVNPAHLGRYERVEQSVVADATAMAAALNEELAERGVEEDRFWTDDLAERIEQQEVVDDREFSTLPDRIDPRVLMTELNDLLPEERVVVTDSGQLTGWVVDRIDITGSDTFIWPMEFGTIGLGQPIGIGADFGAPDTPVVVFCGDGGFQMSLQELNTAVRSERPLLFVVVNDGALGAEYQRMRHADGPADPARIDTPDFATVAEGFGATGHTIRSVGDLTEVADDLATVSGPVVLDCKVDRRIQIPAFDPEYGPETL